MPRSILGSLAQTNIPIACHLDDVADHSSEHLRRSTSGMVHHVLAHRMQEEVVGVLVVPSQTALRADVGHRCSRHMAGIARLERLLALLELLLQSGAVVGSPVLEIVGVVLFLVSAGSCVAVSWRCTYHVMDHLLRRPTCLHAR
jgi:hypothetical protein